MNTKQELLLSINLSDSQKSEAETFNPNVLHRHNNYELYILEDGQHSFLVNGKFFHVFPQDTVLVPPNTLHKIHKAENAKCICIYFTEAHLKEYFTPKTVTELLGCFEKNVISLENKEFFQLKKLITELKKNEGNYNNYQSTQHLGNILMILSSQKDNVRKEPLLYSPEKIIPILSYISDNYKEIDNLDELAARFFISKSYLCRIFKKYTGMTIVHYINHIKIQCACESLLHSEESITNIAINCGFSTSIYFCKIFKKLVGCTPSEYRDSTFF